MSSYGFSCDRFDNMKSAIAIHRLSSCEYLRFWQICKECINQAYQRRSRWQSPMRM
ncbi:hypothetical protein [Nodularia sphaerocarpa]|uniref:hypothetical protein n=1 Tax=Nodularia sphaerocarpa TaxID=137816 RepID=UPI001EFB97B6|nr:hypothetical protein [Nodularia sphaerocarpa]MDB9375936.1 hypothetical protein [Nodularia sphaerocarpa CS-585]MDB9378565.1 hypothetical protein [Nodularia sphaerocarpa CS-585A2]